jgi:pre-mRNA-processing factor 19
VASRKSGNVFERRLIEAYIQENGKDPVSGEDLSIEDLVELKTARAVKPRPPALTSIPSLLSVFQNEWDALALETYTLKQHLSQLRQELSTALYNNDAAVRVIARLTKERDEARDALGRLSLQDRRTAAPTNGANGDAMQVDGQGLPDAIIAKVDATQQRSVHRCRARCKTNTNVSTDYLPHVDEDQYQRNGRPRIACRIRNLRILCQFSAPPASLLHWTLLELLR